MAGFGDSNDIKLNVTLDTKDAVDATTKLANEIEAMLKKTEEQFGRLESLTREVAKAQIAEIEAKNKVEIAAIQAATKELKIKSDAQIALAKLGQKADESAVSARLAGERTASSETVKLANIASQEKRKLLKIESDERVKLIEIETEKLKSAAIQDAKIFEETQKSKRAEINKTIAEITGKARKAGGEKAPDAGGAKPLGDTFSAGKLLDGVLKTIQQSAVGVSIQFGNMNIGLGTFIKTITDNLGPAGPAVAGVIALTKAINAFNAEIDTMAKKAGELEGVKTGFETLQKSIGQSPAKALESLREATQGLISDTQLYQKANQAVLLGVPIDVFNESAAAAVKLGRAMGVDAAYGLESLSLGLGRQSRLYLDNLGIIVSAEEAYRNFGATVGKSAADLSDAEKKAAFLAEALKKIKERAEELPDPLDTVATAQTKATVAQENANRLYLEAFNNSSNLTEQYKIEQGIVEANAKNAQVYGAAMAELGAITKEVTLAFSAAGAMISTVFAGALDFVLRLSPQKQIEDLTAKIKDSEEQVSVLSKSVKELGDKGGILGFIASSNKRQIDELTASIEKDNKELERQKNLLGELDGKNIKIKIDISGIQTAQEGLGSVFADIKKEAEQKAGMFNIAGLPDAEASALLDKYRAAKEEFDNSVQDVAAVDKFKASITELEAALVGSPIKNAATEAAAGITNLANATLKGDFSKAAGALGDVRGALQKVNTAVRTSVIGQKDLKAGIQGVNKQLDEKTKKTKKDADAAAAALKKEQKEFEAFVRAIRRSLETAIPADFQEELTNLFNNGDLGSQEFEKALIDIKERARQAGVDVGALKEETEKLAKLAKAGIEIKINASTTEATDEYNKTLKSFQEQSVNVRDLIFGEEFDPKTGKKKGGAFFGFDLSGLDIKGEAELAGVFQDTIGSALNFALNGVSREDAPAVGEALGALVGGIIGAIYGDAAVGAAVGGIIGEILGTISQGIGKDKPGTRERKKVDEYFAELFERKRLAVVITGELNGAVDEATGEIIRGVEPKLTAISDLVFEGFTPFGGVVDFGGDNFRDYFDTLSTDIQASFNGIGLAFGTLLGLTTKEARLIGIALANNIGGSLQNLQVLIQATGESFEDMAKAVLKNFLDAQLTIEEAYNALKKLEELYSVGIPGAVGAYEEAIKNLNTSLKSDAPGRYAIDSLRDIGAEGEEAKQTFEAVIGSLGKTFNFTAEQQKLLFEALRINGITSLAQLKNASDEQLLAILRNIEIVRDKSNQPLATTPKTELDPKPQQTPRTNTRKENPRIAERKRLREEVRDLTKESQAYFDILTKITSGELTAAAAGAQIAKLYQEIERAVKRRNELEKKLNSELSKGSQANKARLASIAEAFDSASKKVEELTKKANGTTKSFKELDLKGIIPLIKSQNSLGLIATQVGIELDKNVDILIKGFLQGRLSISEVNDEIKKTKELLGPGIPNAVGAVTTAFQNLIDAGTKGGKFSTDAFVDIFAEFREKFTKEGSEFREAQRKQLTANLDAAREAAKVAVGPEATEAAQKALEAAKKALDDFRSQTLAPDLADLRDELLKSFSSADVDAFFRALDESGLKTFEDFEKAGDASIISILGRLKELGFNFKKTSKEITDTNKGLQDAEKEANGGFDPLKEAIELVKQFNKGASSLPPAFNSTTKAVQALNGPLDKLKNGFDSIIEKLGKLSGQTFTNDVVFNIRTTGERGGQALVELLFGDGSDTTLNIGNGSKATNGDSDSKKRKRRRRR